MKKLIVMATCIALLTACNTKPANEDTATETVEVAQTPEKEVIEITGFDTIDELSKSLVVSLQNKDYKGYFTHVMSEEMELAQAEKITDEEIRKEFLHEYGFSLHEEEDYFNELVAYYEKENIDLNNALMDEIEYTEYKEGKYEPLKLYEVFIPIEMDYEMLIDFTIIEVDGKFYLTSELGI